MRVHHIGYAVKNSKKAIIKFEELGYELETETIEDVGRNVSITFMKNENYLVELVAPMGNKSPIDGYLKKNGNSPYHICYEVASLENKIKELSSEKFIIIHNAEIAPAIENKRVVFMFNKDAGLIELVEREKNN